MDDPDYVIATLFAAFSAMVGTQDCESRNLA
jgi:hypothetical protein